jgi:hypothetical protein
VSADHHTLFAMDMYLKLRAGGHDFIVHYLVFKLKLLVMANKTKNTNSDQDLSRNNQSGNQGTQRGSQSNQQKTSGGMSDDMTGNRGQSNKGQGSGNRGMDKGSTRGNR